MADMIQHDAFATKLASGVALVIVDMQNDYCAEGGVMHHAGKDLGPVQAVTPVIRELLQAARSAGVPRFFVAMRSARDGSSNTGPWLAKRQEVGLPDICVEGSWGEQMVEPLAPRDDEPVIRKHRYSGFVGTDFEELLRARGIETLVLTGVATNTCVESTLRDAFERDFHCVVVEDGVNGWVPSLHEATLANVRRRFGTVVKAEEVLDAWR